jgi:hypothetical protein
MELHKLQKVVLPSSLESIGEFGFTACENVSIIKCPATTPPVCSNYVFSNTDKQACKLYVPENAIESYKTANMWKDFFNIESDIHSVTTDAVFKDGTSYDLQGRKVRSQYIGKGLYISNGKKIIVR